MCGMWTRVKKHYVSSSETRKMCLRSQFDSLRMTEGMSVMQFNSKLSEVARQLQELGDSVGEAELKTCLLRGVVKAEFEMVKTMCRTMDYTHVQQGVRPEAGERGTK